MTLSQKIFLVTCRPLLNILFSWKAEGRENVPLTGPLILVANHVHVLDPIFLAFSLSRWITFVAKEELFRSLFLRLWLRWAGSLPLQRDGKVREKQRILESARKVLEEGLILGMFPEGGRSHDGKLRRGKPGSAVIASKRDVPLLPVGIAGTDKIHGISWLWKRPRIVVKIGKPFKLPPTNNKISKSQMQLLTTQLMREIAALLPPECQGAYEKHED
ncbi:MAG: 1-acyl-sn-glycerol-3-phosphate acyltransferase [Dehalococcoidia bacterium]|nr:MAG: 1-acyl-sn-glycerol-3-phosphate acyltransferase [Dehalococcoidia bacterium]TEU16653.1 MAG: 1-acyl-sn-glycerol-3-phosphate acyltransferase [Dehalococcoidia bacterium]